MLTAPALSAVATVLLLGLLGLAAAQSVPVMPVALVLASAASAAATAALVVRTIGAAEHEARALRASRRRLLQGRARERREHAERLSAAEQALRAPSAFLAGMSHDLRSPLNAILGFSEVMQKEIMGPLENPTYRDYAGSIHQSGAQLLQMIDGLLDLARIDSGLVEMAGEPVHLVDVLEDARGLLRSKLANKGVELVVAVSADAGPIRADEQAIRQMSVHLIANALRSSPHGGRISVSVTRTEDGGQTLSVADAGILTRAGEGAAGSDLSGPEALAGRHLDPGTRLGLALVTRLTQLHDGHFGISSELGRGTEATVKFPPGRVLGSAGANRPAGVHLAA